MILQHTAQRKLSRDILHLTKKVLLDTMAILVIIKGRELTKEHSKPRNLMSCFMTVLNHDKSVQVWLVHTVTEVTTVLDVNMVIAIGGQELASVTWDTKESTALTVHHHITKLEISVSQRKIVQTTAVSQANAITALVPVDVFLIVRGRTVGRWCVPVSTAFVKHAQIQRV